MTVSVGLLIYQDFDLRDLADLYHILASARRPAAPDSSLFALSTVARTKELVQSLGGLQILPDHIYPDAYVYDVILVPGGPGYEDALRRLRLMNWLERASRLARIVAAVGTGTFLLAAARLLTDQPVANVSGLSEEFPTLHPQRGRTVVRTGKIITAVGSGAGQELGQTIISEFYGANVVDRSVQDLPG